MSLRRRAAIDRFAEHGFPDAKDEEWRGTSVAPITAVAFEPATIHQLDAAALARLLPPKLVGLGIRLVFVNGQLDERLCAGQLPPGLEAVGLAHLLQRSPGQVEPYFASPEAGKPFRALNSAFFKDGAFVLVREGVSLEQPIHLIFVSTSGGRPTLSTPRNLILLGERSHATIVETYVGAGASTLTDALTEIHIGAGAGLDHYRLERESTHAFHTGATIVEVAREARYCSFSVSEGGAIARHELEVTLTGPGAACSLDGLTLASGRQLIDHHTFVDHAQPSCTSRQLYKSVLQQSARSIFQGRVLVPPDAQKTDARQSCRTLLLSPDAQASSKPQLEIHADDVKCSHGAAVGQLDHEALFYLRTRGIGEAEARSMLTEAFAGEVLSRMGLSSVRETIEASLREQLLAGEARP
jgi:Fe-S cluster assembly protein SufD